MEKYVKSSRIVVLALVMAILLSVYGMTLYRIQAIDSEAIMDSAEKLTESTTLVHAARGPILDRNGELLISDRVVYDVVISRERLLRQEKPNDIILKLIRACSQYGVTYSDPFPVTLTAPFEYYADATARQKSWMAQYFEYFTNSLTSAYDLEDPADTTATQLIAWMRGEHYKIDYTLSAEDARLVIGVRFGLEMQAINGSEYIFAQDVPDEFVGYIMEQNMSCVSVNTRSVREYHTPYAAHLLGYLGSMSAQEYQDKYKDLGYPYNAQVGKTGVEAAFEEYLHGTDGKIVTYTDADGAVNDVQVLAEAQAGSAVFLTIDIGLQATAENALRSTIFEMNQERAEKAEKEAETTGEYEEPELAIGGAVVVMNVHTGEVLALASYPTFDLGTFYENYASLSSDPVASPLTNRATMGLYNPGSTFKMVTAFAALRGHTISTGTTIYDGGKFTKYPDYQPTCSVYPGSHGTINVVQALEKSCNFFFYTVADQMGPTRMAEAARLFGLGDHSGIEIGDAQGEVASVELKRDKYNEGWWDADTLLACIGQGYNRFTPIELAGYVSTIANGGTHYYATLLRNVSSYDFSAVSMRREPQVESVIDDAEGYIPVLQQGMRAVARSGTAASALADYPIPVAAKTGTVQNDKSKMNDGVFVCYAPADDPEIAIAVVVEKGGSGAALITIAKDVLDDYFSVTMSSETTVRPDNSLLK